MPPSVSATRPDDASATRPASVSAARPDDGRAAGMLLIVRFVVLPTSHDIALSGLPPDPRFEGMQRTVYLAASCATDGHVLFGNMADKLFHCTIA